MKKNVLGKIALLTLGFVIALAILFFAFLSIATPGVLAGWCEKTGNYSMAARYASLHYAYTGDVEEVARCTQDSILAENDKYVVRYGTQFIDHEDFDAYCAERDLYYGEKYNISYSYRQYIYGEIAVSYYSNGDTISAIGCAIEALDTNFDRALYTEDGTAAYTIYGFADSNALITLSLKVINNYDEAAAEYIAAVLSDITAEGQELTNLTLFTAIMTAVAQGTY
ncbi:MAG: hypothetical protein LUI60_01525 [Clostridia bacterium]|nr:hypothetical protein [Clostridia bacterium]